MNTGLNALSLNMLLVQPRFDSLLAGECNICILSHVARAQVKSKWFTIVFIFVLSNQICDSSPHFCYIYVFNWPFF